MVKLRIDMKILDKALILPQSSYNLSLLYFLNYDFFAFFNHWNQEFFQGLYFLIEKGLFFYIPDGVVKIMKKYLGTW